MRVHQDQVPPPQRAPVAMEGCRAFTPELRNIVWPSKFKPDLPPRYDGTADPAEFLQLYELSIEVASSDEKVMANWFPMALRWRALVAPDLSHGIDLLLGRDARVLHRQLPRHSRPPACRW